MKRLTIRLTVSIVTFLTGFAVYTLLSGENIDSTSVSPPPLIYSDCVESSTFPGLSIELRAFQKGKSGYFPKGTWGAQDDFINDWYGEHLAAMNERSLLDAAGSKRDWEIYRFLWLRSFHHPIVVRIERSAGGIVFFDAAELSGRGGYEPGRVTRQTSRYLDKDQWCEFVRRMEKAKFWTVPSDDDRRGIDGADWILEGVKNGRYHLAVKWSPDKGDYRAACLYLLQLSGLESIDPRNDLY